MVKYSGERSVQGENTYSLGRLDAPEWLIRAVESEARIRGVSRLKAARQLLAEAASDLRRDATDPFRGASCPRCGREMTLTDEACDEHPALENRSQ